MINCPELLHDNSMSILFYDVVFWSNLILNPYVIFCIIFRSPKNLKNYRWYLLYHQIIAVASDVAMSCLIQPVYLLPFTAAYANGILASILPPRYYLVVCGSLLGLTLASDAQLFILRYLAAQGKDHFPRPYVTLMVFAVFVPFIPIVGVHLSYREVSGVLKDWQQRYSCITPSIVSIPNLMAYDRSTVSAYATLPLFIALAIFLTAMISFIILTYRITTVKMMSTNLRRMQRLYLRQLILQAFIPITLLIIPGVPFALIMVFEIYGFEYIGPLTMATMSTFSLCGAVVLLIMNPTYHDWLTKRARPFVKARSTSVFDPRIHRQSLF